MALIGTVCASRVTCLTRPAAREAGARVLIVLILLILKGAGWKWLKPPPARRVFLWFYVSQFATEHIDAVRPAERPRQNTGGGLERFFILRVDKGV